MPTTPATWIFAERLWARSRRLGLNPSASIMHHSDVRATVLGASGKVGQWLVTGAVDSGFQVRAVYRRQPEVPPEGAETAIEKEPLTVDSLRRTCGDADCIFSAVGQRRRHPRNPWSKILSPHDLCLQMAQNLDIALGERKPRLFFVSAGGVGESRDRFSRPLRFVFDRSNIGIGYSDLADMERYLQQTRRTCLVVQPTTLTNGSGTSCKQIERYGLFSSIPRRAVAEYMVKRALSNDVAGYEMTMISGD